MCGAGAGSGAGDGGAELVERHTQFRSLAAERCPARPQALAHHRSDHGAIKELIKHGTAADPKMRYALKSRNQHEHERRVLLEASAWVDQIRQSDDGRAG